MTLTSKERVDKPMDHHFAIRKISSEDDVGIIPYTPNVVSVYADSIRRQRSDSFVHSYNNNNRITGTTKIATAKTTTAKTTTTKTTTNTTLQTRTLSIRRPIHIDLKHEEVDSEDDQEKQTVYLDYNNNITRSRSNSNNTNNSFQNSVGNSLHINTSLSTPGNTNKNDTGAILEGVLIRRAIRPSSHLTQQQANKEDSLSSSPKDGLNLSSPSSSASSPSSMTETVTPSVLPSSSTSTPISIPDSSIPWQPPSLTIPTHNNTNNTAISSLDNENTMSSVVSKLIPRKEKQMDDYTKHPSLFKRLAHIHHHNHYGPKLYRDDHLYENMLMSPSNTTSIDQDTELDRYGFQKATQWISLQTYHDFEKYYQPILERRQLRWQQLLDDYDSKFPDRCTQVKRYIRKGVPSPLRGRVWFHYSGAEAKMDGNPGVYQKFLKRAQEMGDENEFADLIERDLHRTFPDNIQFSKAAAEALATTSTTMTKPPAIDVLRRVLSAFSVYCPSVGYCQSLNYLVGMLLLFLKEEETFWCLVTIAQSILPAGVYDVTMEGASIDQAVLMMLLYERMPQLWYKMTPKTFWEAEADGVSMPTITLVTSHWFLTLFINILPTETVLRVWDCFFYEGSSVLFRIALTIFKMVEPVIDGVDDPLELFQIIQNFPKRLIDCQSLMDNAFRRYGTLVDISNEDLDRRREICRDLRKTRRTMTPDELTASRNKGDTSFRKKWKLTLHPSSSTTHHLGGSSRK